MQSEVHLIISGKNLIKECLACFRSESRYRGCEMVKNLLKMATFLWAICSYEWYSYIYKLLFTHIHDGYA